MRELVFSLTYELCRNAVAVGDIGMSLGVTANAMRLWRMVPERYLTD